VAAEGLNVTYLTNIPRAMSGFEFHGATDSQEYART
jgi:hypothetical protein